MYCVLLLVEIIKMSLARLLAADSESACLINNWSLDLVFTYMYDIASILQRMHGFKVKSSANSRYGPGGRPEPSHLERLFQSKIVEIR